MIAGARCPCQEGGLWCDHPGRSTGEHKEWAGRSEQRPRELDRLAEDLNALSRQTGEAVLDDARVHQLLTISGVNATSAIALLAATGDISRFLAPKSW